jgi:hypothetical protein
MENLTVVNRKRNTIRFVDAKGEKQLCSIQMFVLRQAHLQGVARLDLADGFDEDSFETVEEREWFKIASSSKEAKEAMTIDAINTLLDRKKRTLPPALHRWMVRAAKYAGMTPESTDKDAQVVQALQHLFPKA